MAIAKFEAYQHAIEIIQTRMSDLELDNQGQSTAKFILEYISQQNKDMIDALKKIQQAGYELPNNHGWISYTTLMSRHVKNIDDNMKVKANHQIKFLKQLSSFLLVTGSVMTIACCATPALVGVMLANMIQLLIGIIVTVSAYTMGKKTYQYANDPSYNYPRLDQHIVKNWDDDTPIPGYPANGHQQPYTVKELKSAFSSTRFFKHGKSLDDLIEETYQHNMQR